MAAATPESGTGTTTSASAGHSRASNLPSISRDSDTERPEHDGIGPREVDVLEHAIGSFAFRGEALARVSPSGPAITISPGSTSFR